MANTAIATPNILTNPGFLYWSPLATAEPAHTAVASKFSDTWPTAWIPLGPTEDGSKFSYESTVEPIRVAELFDPVTYETTEQSGSLAFSLANYTLTNIKRALNGGAITLVGAGTGATAVNKYEPPEPEGITRCMIGWESLDSTVRLVARQCLNGGAVESAFGKAPAKALIPFNLNLERPAGAKAFALYSAGTARA